MAFSLGIDFGTSGARLIAIDTDRNILHLGFQHWEQGSGDLAQEWQKVLFDLIRSVPDAVKVRVGRLAIDGTSSTVLLCDRVGKPLLAPLLYHDGRGVDVLDDLRAIAPPNHPVISATSSLAKLFWWARQADFKQGCYFLHQADWLAAQLHGKLGISDYHNALKLGYDVGSLSYPHWLENHPYRPLLPQILAPGTAIGNVLPEIAAELGLPPDCMVCAGTTDSIAAFLASGADTPGLAVTSLGSTLVLKLLSDTRVDDVRYGIYSHRLGDRWLVGGASNTGGAVLKAFFSDRELIDLSNQIDPDLPSSLDYYPLLTKGDRFPINDPNLPPRLTPRPENPVEFLHGLLAGIARIEARGYQLLAQLGATPLTGVYSAGGGAKNPTWTKIRERYLRVPFLTPRHQDAAYGTAILCYLDINTLGNFRR
jgi:sugar (pentulose or hexulose) kinase